MITFKRSKPGRYSVFRDGVHIAEIMRYSTKWIAWTVADNRGVRGPWGLGGSPFNTLLDAKRHFIDGRGIRISRPFNQ